MTAPKTWTDREGLDLGPGGARRARRRCVMATWSQYTFAARCEIAERWDIRESLRSEIQDVEKRLLLYEQSLVDGLRTTEPRVPLKPRGVIRRRSEIRSLRAFLAEAREILARQAHTTLPPWPGWYEAACIEEREAREQPMAQGGRPRHGLRVLTGGRA